jgi:hypothetical protein
VKKKTAELIGICGKAKCSSNKEERNTPFCPLQENFHTFVLRGLVKTPYEFSPANLHLAYFPPPESWPRRACSWTPSPAPARIRCRILPFTGEISYRCFTGCQKYF